MCASTPEHVELLEPPSDSKPGDRIECEGYDCTSPDAQIKKELSDQILPDMSTNDKGEATFKGVLWKVANGKGTIKSKSLINVPIK
jgi:aminoacyl tRNA synthase complex-interacting multifunctional protein 1